MPDLAAIRARLGLCCYTCHKFVASEKTLDTCAYCGLSEWIHHYKRDVAALLAALDGKDKALRQAKRALDAFLPKYCFPLAPEHEEEARAIANVMTNIDAAIDAKAQKEDGDTCSDCPPSGYPTDKTRCDECPRRAQKEADRG